MRRYQSTLSIVHRAANAALIFVGLWLACTLTDTVWSMSMTLAAAVAAVLFYIVAEVKQAHRSWRTEPMSAELWQLLEAWLYVGGVSIVVIYLQQDVVGFPPKTMALWLVATPALLISWRATMRFTLRRARALGYNTRKLAIAGSGELARQVARTVDDESWMGFDVVGLFDDQIGGTESVAHASKRSLDMLVEKSRNGAVDVIYIALPPGAAERSVDQLIRKLSDGTASVYLVQDRRSRSPGTDGGSRQVVPDLWRLDVLHRTFVDIRGIKAVSVYESPFLGQDQLLKRLEDITVSGIALLLLAVPMVLIGIGVKRFNGPGPVFFKQRRYGLDGKEFLIWKFRSMSVCEDDGKIVQATKHDARVTRFGRLLRRTSLDELPQFINVFLGSMSIVGPRPHAIAHNEYYRQLVGGYMLRHKVKPGITGWAQVNGWRGETDSVDKMGRRVDFDLDYIRNWSLWFDLRIIFLTAFKVCFQKNAY